ncbi:hypothetical protein N7447_002060 [Penicillium robsamsonii]|uniref:uncharacterized protein n=1 Tax=Penicillium robsamsonii TaxID=1792511 RepID=UPI002548F09F|nr:uncharacterized protein N7447_002060 [Penicillium robsamsonii]KAJ5836034.1 hypothetical protein N7447_002060 [Penicillium robsamsonii]
MDLDTGNTSAHGSSARGVKRPALTCPSVPPAFVWYPQLLYDSGLEGRHPPPLHTCNHCPQPIYDSPMVGVINAVSSITECETYEKWRSQIDISVASVDSWLRDLATRGESHILLRATVGAFPSFLGLLSSTLTAVLEYD